MKKIVDGIEVDLTDQEIAEITEARRRYIDSIGNRFANDARRKRDELLKKSDWVVLRAYDQGNPVPAAWSTYRQQLRDVTSQSGFPNEIDWPQAPEESGMTLLQRIGSLFTGR